MFPQLLEGGQYTVTQASVVSPDMRMANSNLDRFQHEDFFQQGMRLKFSIH